MISLLLHVENIESLLERISAVLRECSKPGGIELVITVDSADKLAQLSKSLDQYKKNIRVICKNCGQLNAEDNLHQIFNFSNQFIHPDSYVVVPLEAKNIMLPQDWDVKIRSLYEEHVATLGHKAFLFHLGGVTLYTREWIDTVSGFGFISNIAQWNSLVLAAIPEDHRELLQSIAPMTMPSSEATKAEIRFASAAARSLGFYIDSIKRRQALSAVLNRMDVNETANYISQRYPTRESFLIPLTRYFSEASSYILRHSTLPLLRVIRYNVLYHRGLIPKEAIPKDSYWHENLDNWCMEDMPRLRKE